MHSLTWLILLLLLNICSSARAGTSNLPIQPERVRRAVSDGKQPLAALVRPDDELVIVEPQYPPLPERGEVHVRKPLSEELDGLIDRAPLIVVASVTGARSFLVDHETDIWSEISVNIERAIKVPKTALLTEKTVATFRWAGGEVRVGHARIRTAGFLPFPRGARYVMWFIPTSEKGRMILFDWISVDQKARLVSSTPPNWRDREMGKTHLYGLPLDFLIAELRKRQE